ncbi:MAG: type III-A CRISPR-associated RAMP protein Csm5 [Bryobacteraceae bacterium]|nr:type III-A CRISPR-associated RAMP protein Csm5 [Bryobacteraceae bacterium]
MTYRVTCLTPTLVGDGQRLSPIDYMVWKDQVNVLDQRRIFKLLAKGPRLEGYLTQLRKADKLDFASWGGFAQNFPLRRIPFEHPSLTAFWEKQRAEALFVPTFATSPSGPYLPGSALRGALHTALLFSRWTEGMAKQVAERFEGDRPPRRPAETAEEQGVGLEGYSRLRSFGVPDSSAIPATAFKIYLIRTSTLVARGQGKLELGWKTPQRGSVDNRRVDESGAQFCEMASPGTAFEGPWLRREWLADPERLRQLRWRHPLEDGTLLEAANAFSAKLLAIHREYAATAGLQLVEQSVSYLEEKVAEARQAGRSCVLPVGWGGGFLTKVANPATDDENFRKVLRQLPFYSRAIQTGLPFPKTRRVVFLSGQPAMLPGWVRLDLQT